jgi:long-chain fatty acid transport protein
MRVSLRIAVWVCFVGALAVSVASTAQAGGVEVLEQGRGVGNANAGVRASGDDASTVYWNPAAMTRFRCSAAAFTAAAILPDAEFIDEGSYRLPAAAAPLIPYTGETGTSDDPIFTGSVYGIWSVSPSWKVGLGINVPFGLTSDWGRTWIGRYYATKSELMTVNINPSVAYKINRCWSVAAGVSAMYAKTELGTAIDFGALLPAPAPQAFDGHVNHEGDGWGFGFNAGVLFEPSNCLRFGLHYRSRVKQELEGEATFEVPAAAAPIAAATGRFADTDVETEITFPENIGLSVFWQASAKLALMADVTWTGWSTFDQLVIKHANPAEPDVTMMFDWDDTWRVAVGAAYALNNCWTLRAGLAWDQSPINDVHRTPRVPGNDRFWISGGVGFRLNSTWSFDLFGAYILVDDAPISLASIPAGWLIGHVESTVGVVGFQVNADF